MSERFLDDLARVLAEPMPRRRVLGVIGAAVVAAAVPRWATASPRRVMIGVPAGHTTRAVRGTCGPPGLPCQNDPYYCRAPGTTCCPNNPHNYCAKASDCCSGGRECCRTNLGQFCCNYSDPTHPGCCDKGQLCVKGACVETCPPGTKKCGRYCCPHGQKCRNGRCCKQCAGPKSQCCDPQTEQCCIDKKTCCKTATQYCCAVGATSANYAETKSTCCAKPGDCLRESIDTGGLVKSSKFVCCPPEMQVFASETDTKPQMCCPPGMVSKGKGKFTLEAGAHANPFCCKKELVCGDACCVNDAFNQETCCNGKCTSLISDEQNCGSCGRACLATETCKQGECVAA
ncbi:MAG: hypothetical protein ACXVZO_09255 [Gaiellaceae bacterium]